VKWEGLAEDEDGDAVELIDFHERVVQVAGTFSSETVIIQGSMDGTNWFTLRDLQDNDLSFTVAGVQSIQENTRYVRPSVGTGGGAGTVNIDVIIGGVAAS
jgi:hypothetical protein